MKHMISVVSILSAFALICNFASAIDTKGLVLYLPLDEGKGDIAKDASANKFEGKLNGKAEWTKGKYGTAIKVAGPPSSVVVKDDDKLDGYEKTTMTAWAYVESLPSTYNSILTKAETYMIHTTTEGKPAGTAGWEPLVWFGGSYGQWQTAASIPVKLSEWHHIAGVWDGNEIRTYIDGELKGKTARAGKKIDVTAADLIIGYDSRGCCSGRISTQTIDEVQIWNRDLSEAEVKEIMKGPQAFGVEAKGKLALTWGELKR